MSNDSNTKNGVMVFKRFYVYIADKKKKIALGIALSSIVSGTRAATAYIVKPLLDQVFMAKNKELLMLIPIALFVIFLVQGLARFFSSYVMESVGEKAIMEIRNDLYKCIQGFSLPFFDSHPSAMLMSRVTNDVKILSSIASDLVPNFMRQVLTLIFLLGYVFWLAPKMATVYLIATPLVIVPFSVIGKKLRKLSRKDQEKVADITYILQETFQGSKVVKAFGMEDYETQRFYDETKKLYDIKMSGILATELLSPLMEFLGAIGASAVIYYSGSQVISGTLSPGTFFSFLTALGMLYEPLRRLSKMYGSFQQSVAAAERILDIYDSKDPIKDCDCPIKLVGEIEKIRYKNVKFRYDTASNSKGEMVLSDIDFEVSKGKAVAIVGKSGAGKTTLLDLLPRFYDPTEGSVEINGIDIKKFKIDDIRQRIAIVTQDTVLFDDTIRNNIAYGMFNIAQEEIEKAAKMAYAEEFIKMFPDGYDTLVGEGGGRLSGGQKKRITIARAFLKNPEILLLDEATSELDSESEKKVQAAIENLMKNRTTLIIAHRLSTIMNADIIMVMDKGRIIETGTHSDLIKKDSGMYRKLYEIQSHGEQVF